MADQDKSALAVGDYVRAAYPILYSQYHFGRVLAVYNWTEPMSRVIWRNGYISTWPDHLLVKYIDELDTALALLSDV